MKWVNTNALHNLSTRRSRHLRWRPRRLRLDDAQHWIAPRSDQRTIACHIIINVRDGRAAYAPPPEE